MTYWNYRVIRSSHQQGDSTTLHIHEVYYSEDGEIEMWSAQPESPCGETIEELRTDLEYFAEALRNPILEEREENGKAKLVAIC